MNKDTLNHDICNEHKETNMNNEHKETNMNNEHKETNMNNEHMSDITLPKRNNIRNKRIDLIIKKNIQENEECLLATPNSLDQNLDITNKFIAFRGTIPSNRCNSILKTNSNSKENNNINENRGKY
jgi:hypothetical protein